METMSMSATDAHVFVGLNGPYKTDSNNDGDLSDETANENAKGIWMEGADFAYATMEPAHDDLSAIMRSFTAASANAEQLSFVGGSDDFQLGADSIRVAYNDGVQWQGDIGTAVVDWSASFPADTPENDRDNDGDQDPAGLEIVTPSGSVYVDHDGNPRMRASATNAHLQISEFVHVVGDVSMEKGPTENVDVVTGLPDNLDSSLEASLQDAVDNHGLMLSEGRATISGFERFDDDLCRIRRQCLRWDKRTVSARFQW